MQLKIEFELTTGTETLIVDLLNNPGVDAWVRHCRQLPPARIITKQPVGPTPQAPVTEQWAMWEYQQSVQTALANTRYPLPMPVISPDEITQQHLNVWHRWFTNNTKIIGTGNREYAVEFHWLHEINQVVHQLENHVYEWPKQELGQVGWDLNLQPEMDCHGFGIGFVDLAPHQQYHTWDHADLILDQAIHGKSTMQSFIDNDDPKNWDTTGHHISWGGCKLVNKNFRPAVYQGSLFQQWMSSNGVTHQDLWGDYPLGNIVNRDQTQLDRIFEHESKDFVSTQITVLD